jgi:hypothetical protein
MDGRLWIARNQSAIVDEASRRLVKILCKLKEMQHGGRISSSLPLKPDNSKRNLLEIVQA